MEVLQILPDRIGHGTCLQAETGGSDDLVKFVRDSKIPLGGVFILIFVQIGLHFINFTGYI